MPKFKVTFEASAAVMFDVTVEAENEEEARGLVEEGIQRGSSKVYQNAEHIVGDLMCVDPAALDGYNGTARTNFTRATVEIDEAGFEVVEVEEGE